LKSALFVDFDNVYSGLRTLDARMADRFALKPQRWMEWLVTSLGLPDHAPKDARRRVLVRRCYLNPQAYQRFRPSFNLAGFEIVDCPALTSEGKTSTDIHMVLDIIDLLQHEAHYDEFIVFSADADFTPVLRRLRRWDRRTTVLAIGFPSAAYRASADMLIDQDDFLRSALGFRDDDELPVKMVRSKEGEHEALDRKAVEEAQPAAGLADIATWLRGEVAKARQPVSCARIGQLLAARYPAVATDWKGLGTFRKLVDALDLGELVVDWNDAGGRIHSPTEVAAPETAAARASGPNGSGQSDWGVDTDLLVIATQIHDVTGAPLLAPDIYGLLFSRIADDLAEYAFVLAETSKRVRDRMRASGHPVGRADVTWVLRGLLFRGHVFGQGKDDVHTMAHASADNLRSLCLREQMVIDTATDAAIRSWIEAEG
jgi:hypothetical protein